MELRDNRTNSVETRFITAPIQHSTVNKVLIQHLIVNSCSVTTDYTDYTDVVIATQQRNIELRE